MPRLEHNARNFAFVGGIAQDKAVLPAVLHQPYLHCGFFLRRIEILIVDINNINRQSQLMLTCSGYGNPLPASMFASLPTTFRYNSVHLVIIELLLFLLSTV